MAYWTSFILIFISLVSMSLKIFYFDYDLSDVIPDQGYKLVLEIDVNSAKAKKLNIATFAPVNNKKHTVIQEEGVSDTFNFRIQKEADNRLMIWDGAKIIGENKLRYVAKIKSYNIKYLFTKNTVIDTTKYQDEQIKPYLDQTDAIQVQSKLIQKKTKELTQNKNTIYEKIEAIHNFIVKDIKYANFSGALDAVSTLQLKEASCNGKSRLYVAMVRNLGLPARLVGGIILNHSPKKVIHQWLEIYINGKWVPFCPTNNHFAELDDRYIILYYNDMPLFKRTSGIDFDYSFSFDKISIAKSGLSNKFQDLPINIFSIMDNFTKFNFSLNIFIYLLMLPLAAIVSVILRNIIGLETFGTFLPILVASVLKGTGLGLGIVAFFTIIFIIFMGNKVLNYFELLYHPKMAILLSLVIMTIISVFYFAMILKNYELVNLVFFPVAIMAITINRVTTVIEEDGLKKLIIVTLNTVLVILISYYFINSTFLQLSMLSFPELILLFIGLNILIGRWSGFRLMEYIRFKGLFAKG